MNAVKVAIVQSFSPPPQGAEIVVFSGAKNYIAHYDTPRMLTAAIRYAKDYGVYLVTDRFVSNDHLCLCMLDPNGDPCIGQQAIYQNLTYRGLFKRDSLLETAQTPFAKVGLLVDVDINYPQILRLATSLGVQLIISSAYIELFDFYEDRIQYSNVNAAISNGIYVISACSAGCCIVNPSGNFVAPFTEDLPIFREIFPSAVSHNPKVLQKSTQLIKKYRDVLMQKNLTTI